MSALDFIEDRKNPRLRLLEAKWRGLRNGHGLEVDGVDVGDIDWNRSSHVDTGRRKELWAWLKAKQTYYVLDRVNDLDNPPRPAPSFGPSPRTEVDDDT